MARTCRHGMSFNQQQRSGGQREWEQSSFGLAQQQQLQQYLAEQVPRRNQDPIPPFQTDMSLSAFAMAGGGFGDDGGGERRGHQMRMPIAPQLSGECIQSSMSCSILYRSGDWLCLASAPFFVTSLQAISVGQCCSWLMSLCGAWLMSLCSAWLINSCGTWLINLFCALVSAAG